LSGEEDDGGKIDRIWLEIYPKLCYEIMCNGIDMHAKIRLDNIMRN